MTPRTRLLTLLALFATTAGLRAETHTFVPTVFYNTFAASHPPALRIRSGDRVITSTVDDTGAGADGRVVTPGPNPQTGPFYVDGAEAGDLLVVTIEKLTPNRIAGMSTSIMVPNSVAPGGLNSRPDATRYPWTIEAARGVVRLDLNAINRSTPWDSRFSAPAFEMPLRPTLASIGVAPAGGEAFNTTVPGRFGGNLMTTSVTEGVRVMLPVFHPGALLFLGHGRARQGDGGVTGTGVETSLDVEFSVELVKKKSWPHSSGVRPSTVIGEFEIGWPRIESDDYLMAVGSAPSVIEALQHATLELHHWLDDDFGLSEKAASVFLGQAIEYEIASIAAPGATVVAKVRKSYLPRPIATP
jgi:amidase